MYTTEIKQKQNPRGKSGAGKEAENRSIFIGSPILRAKPPFDHLQNAQGHVGSLQRLNALPSTQAPVAYKQIHKRKKERTHSSLGEEANDNNSRKNNNT